MKILNKLRTWTVNQLLKETGVDLSPEPDVWGVLSQAEEDNVLARLWNDKEWLALMKKYAEGANKALIVAVRNKDIDLAMRYVGQFFSYNSMILKSRRAARKIHDRSNEHNSDKV